jgi:catechol 2,3-dioxygenase-like lactoylglutathione lyase family enzyme
MTPPPALVPELMVRDLAASLRFWCGPCGFRIAWERPEEGFACVERDGARVMLDRLDPDGTHRWQVAPATPPFGRHVNLEITLPAIQPVLDALAAMPWPLFQPPEVKTYRVGAEAVTVRQVLVQDPDGYLLRFAEEVRPDAA